MRLVVRKKGTLLVDTVGKHTRSVFESTGRPPVTIFTLGRFSFLINDKQVDFSRKDPRRPLELLKAIIAQGGRGLQPEQRTESLYLALKNARPVNQEMVN